MGLALHLSGPSGSSGCSSWTTGVHQSHQKQADDSGETCCCFSVAETLMWMTFFDMKPKTQSKAEQLPMCSQLTPDKREGLRYTLHKWHLMIYVKTRSLIGYSLRASSLRRDTQRKRCSSSADSKQKNSLFQQSIALWWHINSNKWRHRYLHYYLISRHYLVTYCRWIQQGRLNDCWTIFLLS